MHEVTVGMDQEGGYHPWGRQYGPQAVILYQGEEGGQVGRYVRQSHDDIEEQKFQNLDHPEETLMGIGS